MRNAITILIFTLILSTVCYIAWSMYRTKPIILAAADESELCGPWLSLDDWHWHEETIQCREYIVGQGDTLWGIARRYYPGKHTGEMVWAIRVANDLAGSSGPVLQVGQKIWIPDPMMYGVGRE